MARVICKLSNAAPVMVVGAPSGSREVKFVEDRKQMLSEDLPDDVAEHLATIPGFVLIKAKAKAETEAEKAAREKAEAEAAGAPAA